jgi:non-homologous end joining protein Ku
LTELLKEKQAGIKPSQVAAEVSAPRVINLMDALRRSIQGGQPKKPTAAPVSKRRPAGRKQA